MYGLRFIINNLGYTVERYFNGMDAAYNDVPMWDYGAIFQAMSPETKIKSFKVDKAVDLDALLSDEDFQTATYPQVSEIVASHNSIELESVDKVTPVCRYDARPEGPPFESEEDVRDREGGCCYEELGHVSLSGLNILGQWQYNITSLQPQILIATKLCSWTDTFVSVPIFSLTVIRRTLADSNGRVYTNLCALRLSFSTVNVLILGSTDPTRQFERDQYLH